MFVTKKLSILSFPTFIKISYVKILHNNSQNLLNNLPVSVWTGLTPLGSLAGVAPMLYRIMNVIMKKKNELNLLLVIAYYYKATHTSYFKWNSVHVLIDNLVEVKSLIVLKFQLNWIHLDQNPSTNTIITKNAICAFL